MPFRKCYNFVMLFGRGDLHVLSSSVVYHHAFDCQAHGLLSGSIDSIRAEQRKHFKTLKGCNFNLNQTLQVSKAHVLNLEWHGSGKT